MGLPEEVVTSSSLAVENLTNFPCSKSAKSSLIKVTSITGQHLMMGYTLPYNSSSSILHDVTTDKIAWHRRKHASCSVRTESCVKLS